MESPLSSQGGMCSLDGVLDDHKRHARAQHNALERRRRDNIKDMYTSLKDAVPDMQNERVSTVGNYSKRKKLIYSRITTKAWHVYCSRFY